MKWYQVLVTSPDLRGGIRIIKGGLDKPSAEFEAKRWKALGMIVRVMPTTN